MIADKPMAPRSPQGRHFVNTPEPTTAPKLQTAKEIVATINGYFAILANCERLSLTDTKEPNVLHLGDITHIGDTGLDLVEALQDQQNGPASVSEDPLAELKALRIDRVVIVYLHSGQSFTGALAESADNQIILFEPRSRNSLHYHTLPLSSIAAWTDMRGENAIRCSCTSASTSPSGRSTRSFAVQGLLRLHNSWLPCTLQGCLGLPVACRRREQIVSFHQM
jgi:hypothetical protein